MGGGVSLTETVGGIDMQCNKGRAMRDGLHRTSLKLPELLDSLLADI
jgi:hypothetical protein